MMKHWLTCFWILGGLFSTAIARANGGEDSLPRYYFSEPLVKIEVRYIQPFHRLSGVLDSSFFQMNYSSDIGRALVAKGQVNVFQYGPQGTACLVRMNGLSPDHTQLSWKGISLNSLTLGQMDFSLVPAFFFDYLSMGSSKSIENGANVGFGGNVDLLHGWTSHSPRYRYWTSINSLNNYANGGEANVKRNVGAEGEWSHQLKWLTGNFKNQFAYDWKDVLGERVVQQDNNDVAQKAWLYRTYYKQGSNHWQAQYWMIDRKAQLPNTMGNFSSFLQEQDDQNHRWVMSYLKHDFIRQRFLKSWGIQYAGTTDLQQYRMRYSFEGIADWAESSTSIQQHWLSGQMEFRFRSFSQNVKLNNRNVAVRYQDAQPISQNIYQLLYDARWLGRRFNYYCVADRQYWGKQSNDQIEATAEWVKGVINPTENRYYMRVQASVFYQQRMPDFNERYWPGSGNALLEQEAGKGFKGFMEWMLKPNRRFQSNLTVDVEYNQRWVSNWIQWVPQSNGVWSPVNLSEVQARSMNGNIQGNIPLGNSILRIKSFGQWNDVWIQSDMNQSDANTKRQLPYTPRWKWGAETTWMSQDYWYASLQYRWTDERFTDESNQRSSALSSYQLFDCSVGKTNPNGLAQWSIGIDNIFDLNYQEIRSFALPGRVFKCQMNIQIK